MAREQPARGDAAGRRDVTVLGTIGRLILIPFALLIAAVGTAFVLVTLGLEEVTRTVAGQIDDEIEGWSSAVSIMNFFGAVVSGLSLLPALLVVVIGEVGRIRSLLFYLVGGGLAVAAAPVLSTFVAVGDVQLPATSVLQICATAGFFGGFLYWLLAGRTA
ncbi:MAG: hypothetical protein AAFV26_06830 [Pseudomonadota bacterium]